jgi:hypothetical protein
MMPLGFGGQSELAGRGLQVQGHVHHRDVPTRDVLGVAVGSDRSRIFVGRSSKPARGLLRGHHHDSRRRSARSPRWGSGCSMRLWARPGCWSPGRRRCARPFDGAESTTSTDHEPFLIHCLAASICPAGKCLISAFTKCDVRCSATISQVGVRYGRHWLSASLPDRRHAGSSPGCDGAAHTPVTNGPILRATGAAAREQCTTRLRIFALLSR